VARGAGGEALAAGLDGLGRLVVGPGLRGGEVPRALPVTARDLSAPGPDHTASVRLLSVCAVACG
jgi:hypothetical protein